MRLEELVRRLGGTCALPAGGGPDIRGVALDSRRVEAGDLFVALAGTRADGARFAAQAVERGALAVLAERDPGGLGVPAWVHERARATAGRAAALVTGEPARGMAVVAVTGTNGKTTTAHFTAQLLARAGRVPAVLGTAGHRLAGGVELAATHTTPDAAELWRLLARHRAAGGDAVVLEASSHALVQERLAGLAVDVAVFTGLSRDHLDYHATLAEYAAAKARLFTGLARGATAVLRAGALAADVMERAARAAGADVVTYTVDPESSGTADLEATRRSIDPRGTHLSLNGMGITRKKLWLPLVGRYDVENALAAAAAALRVGASPSAVADGLASLSSAPGRMEPVPTGERGFALFVDYAHTDGALEHACGALRERLDAAAAGGTPGRLVLVFGCGGDRDRGKRAPMGRVAARQADVVVLTSDNPRSEDPAAIAAEVLAGLDDPTVARSSDRPLERHVELDRRTAIALAVALARPGDVVLVAGKGHERTQATAERVLPFDDRAVAREVLA